MLHLNYWPRSCRNPVLKKHAVFYISTILEVTWYEPLYITHKNAIHSGELKIMDHSLLWVPCNSLLSVICYLERWALPSNAHCHEIYRKGDNLILHPDKLSDYWKGDGHYPVMPIAIRDVKKENTWQPDSLLGHEKCLSRLLRLGV